MGDDATDDIWIGIIASKGPAFSGTGVFGEDAISNCRAAVEAKYTGPPPVSVGDGEAVENRVIIFSIIESKSALGIGLVGPAINNAIEGAIFTLEGNGFTVEIYITVTNTGIEAVGDDNHIARVANVDSGLNSPLRGGATTIGGVISREAVNIIIIGICQAGGGKHNNDTRKS